MGKAAEKVAIFLLSDPDSDFSTVWRKTESASINKEIA
jgi:hypothetical protein